MIPSPFLLYLGDSQDELSVKTSRGVAVWRPQACVGEFRGPKCDQTLGLPHLGFEEAKAKGARTVIIGVANAGGIMGPSIVADWVTVGMVAPDAYSIASQVWIQAKGVLITIVWSAVVSVIAFKIVDLVIGLRVPEDDEREGLDITSHGETAYSK